MCGVHRATVRQCEVHGATCEATNCAISTSRAAKGGWGLTIPLCCSRTRCGGRRSSPAWRPWCSSASTRSPSSTRASRCSPPLRKLAPSPGSRMSFTATAYCKGLVTTSALRSKRRGRRRPVGVAGRIRRPARRAQREIQWCLQLLDTGPAVQGREIDVYMWSCYEALAFGRQPVRVTVSASRLEPESDDAQLHGLLLQAPEAEG